MYNIQWSETIFLLNPFKKIEMHSYALESGIRDLEGAVVSSSWSSGSSAVRLHILQCGLITHDLTNIHTPVTFQPLLNLLCGHIP